jgi:uncharacterized protein (TIGR02145 family)
MKKKNRNYLAGKQIRVGIYTLVMMIAFIMLIISCSKEDDNTSNPAPTVKVPVLTTTAVSAITETTATCGGNITSDGGSSVIARGVCWSKGTTPTITDSKTSNGTGTGSFTSAITGLAFNNTYYVRAYATNSAGTGYGNAVSFTAALTDIDGNVYHTVTIGTQVWMVENLKTTKYNDGTSIPMVTDSTAWYKLVTPGYCWYDNDASYKNTYGAMYNWYAVNTGKLCPSGWHVPSDAEWVKLTDFLGGDSIAGGKLKEPGTTHWKTPNNCDSNSTGFIGLPGGHRDYLGEFGYIGEVGYWWSTTAYVTGYAWFRYMSSNNLALPQVAFYKYDGYSVRCLKN